MLKLTPLSKFKNKFTESVIVGSGPTSVNYEYELSKVHEPIFFINDTHRFSRFCPSKHKYFFTHHISKFTDVSPITFFIERMFWQDSDDYTGILYPSAKPKNEYIGIDTQANDEIIQEKFMQKFNLYDKDLIASRNRLLACFGSATTAIHFAWFSGCGKITFIGCNPDVMGGQYDSRIGQQGEMIYDPDKVKENNRILPKMLGLRVVHK